MELLRTVASLAAWGVVGWIALVWACGAIYIGVTYLEAMRHIPPRTGRQTASSILREMWCVAWTQPMLPLFQFVFKRMGSGGGEVPVVMIHGYCQNRVDFLYLATRLFKGGCGQLYAVNFFWPQPLERSARQVVDFVADVRERTGAPRVDVLTHSSGGLLAMDLLAQHPEWVRRTAVVAIPWRGVTWKGPVLGRSGSQLRADSLYTRSRPDSIEGGEVLSVFSVHDNLVHPPHTSRINGPDVTVVEVENLGHLAVLFDRTVGDAVCDFLLAPEDPAE